VYAKVIRIFDERCRRDRGPAVPANKMPALLKFLKRFGVPNHARLNSLQLAVRLRNFLLCFGLPNIAA
jgi:hypothetical protein